MIHSLLSDLESDMGPDAGAAFARLVSDYLARSRNVAEFVGTSRTPKQLAERFREPLPETGQPLAEVVRRVARDVLPDSTWLYHPHYLGHQVSAPLPAAIWMESVIGALNNSMTVFEMSPVATIIEAQVIRWMCDLSGYPEQAGGTLTSGGTEATFTALLAARAAALPHSWERGVGSEPPVIVCGEHAHYAVTRAAGQLGLGTRNTVTIPSYEFRMDASVLAHRLDALRHTGTRVLAVVATAGSTATGSFDDLEAIGNLCEQHGVWLHVDGAHGASALLSREHRHRVRGIERARSIAWDPHKMMLLPLSAGMLLVRDERDLEAAFTQRAPYIFHEGDEERSWDQGVRSFLCSRRADALKLWVALLRYGAGGIGALYEHLCDTTRALYDAIEERDDFESMHEPESNILCFRYVGAGGLNDAQLDALNLEIRTQYNASGAGWITTTVLGQRRTLRATIMNPRTDAGHVRAVLDGLAQLGRRLEAGELIDMEPREHKTSKARVRLPARR